MFLIWIPFPLWFNTKRQVTQFLCIFGLHVHVCENTLLLFALNVDFLCGHRMTIEKRGKLTFCHTRDQNFDVNDYLLELKGQLKTWRDVYWRIWGMINYLTCTRCKEVFPCSDFGHCKYHPEPPRFDNETGINSCIGTYPCCHLKTLRFDPTQQNKVFFFSFGSKSRILDASCFSEIVASN